MSEIGGADPTGEPEEKPRRRSRNARAQFFDLKASHWVQVALTIALLTVGAAQALIYWRQAGIMDKQTKLLSKQGKLSSDVERAWIAATKMELDKGNVENKPIKIILTYGNTGHQPARETVFSGFNDDTIPWSEGKEFPFVPQPSCIGLFEKRATRGTPGWPFIYPSGEPIYRETYTTKQTADAKVRDGTKVLIIRGCWDYQTVNVTDAHSAFCFYLRPNASLPWIQWQFLACPYGNEGN